MKIHRLRAVAGLVGLVALAAVVGPAASAAAPTRTEIRPAALDRDDNGYVPHVDGDDLVVADRRYAFDGREVRFLGYAGDALDEYVVGTYKQGKPASHTVVVVTPDDDRRVVLEGISVPEIVLSSDGDQLFRQTYRFRQKTSTVRVWSTADGSLETRRTFQGYVDVLDAFEGRAVLSSFSPTRTFWWDTGADKTERIVARNSYQADIRSNRLAGVDGDIYQGGCSVVSKLTKPGARLWRSCEQAVLSFSPSGDRVVTTHLLADGLGPSEIQLRTVGGKRIHTFTTYFFGEVWWEADEVLLTLAHGEEKTAWVRCDELGDCERAGKLRDTRA